ncbi:MAG: hypothetical protein U0V56_12425 [Actinomycetota bacterium]
MGRFLAASLGALLLLGASCQRGADVVRDDPPPSEGDRAPGFELPAADGGRVALADFLGKKPVLLYFSMGPG